MSIIPVFKYCIHCGCPVPSDPDPARLSPFYPRCKKILIAFPIPIPRRKKQLVLEICPMP